jgi:hypothetical protein
MSHPYWRLYITANNGNAYHCFAELEMRAQAGGSDQCSGGTASASSTLGGFPASQAFDNTTATAWASNGAESTSWVAYQFAAPVEVAEISLWGSGTPAQSPKDFQLQYSADGVSWTTVATVTNETGWSAYEQRTFTFTLGELTGNIDEGLATAITKWRVTATRCSNGALAGTTMTTTGIYTIPCNTLEPCIIHMAPQIDYAWSANRVCAEGDLMIPPTAESDQKIYVCTAVTGDAQTGASAPTWTTGTIGDNNVTWAYVDQFRNWPVAIGPKFPA